MTDDRSKRCPSYPLGEEQPETVRSASGRPLSDLTLEKVLAGELGPEDFAISSETLYMQAEIARAANRKTLALNFERAAEMVSVPQDRILGTYELLRPGRAKSKEELLALAEQWRHELAAPKIAELIEEAAEVYEARGLYANKRF
jgi:propanediol dehydratase small subunit